MQSSIKAPKIERISVKNWLKGTVTALDDGRTPTDGLRSATNVMLDQDGTVRPRPATVAYGVAFPGTLLGELFEFTKQVSGLTNNNYIVGMFNVSGTTKPYYMKDGGSWTAINGKTYDNSASAHYFQIDDKVMVMNGTDNLSYIDIPTLTVVPFTALSTPTITSVVATGLPGTLQTYYYKITANSTVGETASSAASSVVVGTIRDQWVPATQYVTVTWPAVVGATSYNVYLGSVSGHETLIISGLNQTTYKDDGSAVADVSRLAPAGDSTAGPKVTRGTAINGQAFLVGDKDNPHYVRFGGTGASVLDFSPFGGGGTQEVGRGTKEFPQVVKSFRDGKGNSSITVLCRSTNGQGKRYLLTPQTLTFGDITISFFDVTEDNGQDGTDSPDGVIQYQDSLWYPSRDGFKTTGTKPQLQNILSTSTISETILTDIPSLNSSSMDKCVGVAYQQRLYWALPVGNPTNNQIWTLDLQRGGAWMKPWGISADWMTLYNDNSGATHLLVVSGNALYELTDNQASYDNGTAFSTSLTSGLIKFSDDGMEWGAVIAIIFVLLRPQGVINFTVAGRTEDGTSASGVGQGSFTSSSSVAGWGESGWGGVSGASGEYNVYGWSNFRVIPVAFGDSRREVTVEIDETLQWLTYEIDTNTGGAFYNLSDVIMEYIPVGVLDA